jgi:hypothetical protein
MMDRFDLEILALSAIWTAVAAAAGGVVAYLIWGAP